MQDDRVLQRNQRRVLTRIHQFQHKPPRCGINARILITLGVERVHCPVDPVVSQTDSVKIFQTQAGRSNFKS
jgi:hypothetical protein